MKEDPAPETWAVVPRKIKKRRQHFVMVPWSWIERLNGAAGQTYRVAVILLYMGWKGRGDPVKLSNVALTIDGVSHASKWRALAELERRGLVTVERRPGRSPIVRLLLEPI